MRKSSPATNKSYKGKHRFEHWYKDNQVYFITARCRDRFPAFESAAAKTVFWDRFDHYTTLHGFVPWVTSLMDNHYHTLGYLRDGEQLGPMMQKLHGSVAKLVNDILDDRRTPFWGNAKHSDYMDGCIRDEKQCRRAYQYTLTQSVRHGIVKDIASIRTRTSRSTWSEALNERWNSRRSWRGFRTRVTSASVGTHRVAEATLPGRREGLIITGAVAVRVHRLFPFPPIKPAR